MILSQAEVDVQEQEKRVEQLKADRNAALAGHEATDASEVRAKLATLCAEAEGPAVVLDAKFGEIDRLKAQLNNFKRAADLNETLSFEERLLEELKRLAKSKKPLAVYAGDSNIEAEQ